MLKEKSRDEVLFERAKIEAILQSTIDEATAAWGVEVTGVDVETR